MASTKYFMTVRLEGGSYSEQELLFDHMKDLILGFGSSFDLTDTCDRLISLHSAMVTYRALCPLSSVTMTVGAYPDR